MLVLYGLFAIMLVMSVGVLAIPFLRYQAIYLKSFFLLSAFISIFSITMYHFCGSQLALKKWLSHGKQHYQLLEKFKELGGVEGAIERITQKLAENPEDKKGWLILSKLYLAKGDKHNADLAFAKAQEVNN